MKSILRQAAPPIVIALFAGGIAAQNIKIFPSDHTTIEGATSTSTFPFSYGVARQQLVLDRWDIKVPNGRSITKIGVRPDGTYPSTGYKVQLEVLMGQTSKELKNIVATFATNYDGSPMTVFAKKIVDVPTTTVPTTPPSTNYVLVPLDTPLQYDDSKNLLIDYKLHSNSNGNLQWPYYVDGATAVSKYASLGAGCTTSVGKKPVASAGLCELNGYANFSVKDLLANAPLNLIFNVQGNAGGLPLDSIGATGCSLFVQLNGAVVLPGRSNGGGGHVIQFALPPLRQLYGTPLFVQYVGFDAFANNAGIVVSNAASATMAIAPQALVVIANADPNAVNGYLQYSFPAVTVLEHN